MAILRLPETPKEFRPPSPVSFTDAYRDGLIFSLFGSVAARGLTRRFSETIDASFTPRVPFKCSGRRRFPLFDLRAYRRFYSDAVTIFVQ